MSNKTATNTAFMEFRRDIQESPDLCREVLLSISRDTNLTEKQQSALWGLAQNLLFEAAKRNLDNGGWIEFPLRLARLQSRYGVQISYAQGAQLAAIYYAERTGSARMDPSIAKAMARSGVTF